MSISQWGPPVLIFVGAVLSAAGGIWSLIQSNAQQDQIQETVTGGNSHPVIRPSHIGDDERPRALWLGHQGKHPIYDLALVVTDVTRLRELHAKGGGYANSEYQSKFHVGTIGRAYELRLMEIPSVPQQKSMIYHVQGFARNGSFDQRMVFTQSDKNRWHFATRITKDGKQLHEYVSPGATDAMRRELAAPMI